MLVIDLRLLSSLRMCGAVLHSIPPRCLHGQPYLLHYTYVKSNKSSADLQEHHAPFPAYICLVVSSPEFFHRHFVYVFLVFAICWLNLIVFSSTAIKMLRKFRRV